PPSIGRSASPTVDVATPPPSGGANGAGAEGPTARGLDGGAGVASRDAGGGGTTPSSSPLAGGRPPSTGTGCSAPVASTSSRASSSTVTPLPHRHHRRGIRDQTCQLCDGTGGLP